MRTSPKPKYCHRVTIQVRFVGGFCLFLFYFHFNWKIFGSLYHLEAFQIVILGGKVTATVLEYFPGVRQHNR